jgi:gustatory receptor
MSVFEQLNPFVSLCQACGMIPYTVERNSATNKFEKFTFSFKHFTTWWFFFGLVLQVTFIVMLANSSNDLSQELTSDRKMPVTVPILFWVTQLFRLAELLLSRWIVLRFRRLRTAVQTVQEVERLFAEKILAQHRKKNSSITLRFVIGFILVITAVKKHNKTHNL